MYSTTDENDAQWAPVSDLMAVLMLIFMFIAIVFVRTVVNQERVFQEKCDNIYQVLQAEFSDDFVKWDVELLQDLTIRFRNPKILFPAGEHKIPQDFRHILSDFFPRYMESVQEFSEDIREIRIEGHTSSEWTSKDGGAESPERAYFLNMGLSQRRTRAILQYILQLPSVRDYAEWAKPRITANGLSSSRLMYHENQLEDRVRSRRVEFRLLTSSCQKAGAYENRN